MPCALPVGGPTDLGEWFDWLTDANLWQGFYGGALAFASAVGIFFLTRRLDRRRAASDAVAQVSLALYEASGVFDTRLLGLAERADERASMLAAFKRQLLLAQPHLPPDVRDVTDGARRTLTRWATWATDADEVAGAPGADPQVYRTAAAEVHLWVNDVNVALAEFRAGKRDWKGRLPTDPKCDWGDV